MRGVYGRRGAGAVRPRGTGAVGGTEPTPGAAARARSERGTTRSDAGRVRAERGTARYERGTVRAARGSVARPAMPLGPAARPGRSARDAAQFGVRRQYAHELAVDELLHAELRELPSVAGALDPPKRQVGLGRGRVVDPDHAGLHPLGHPTAPFHVRTEDGPAEAVLAVVGQGDRLVLVLDPVDHRGGPEEFFRVRAHAGLDAGEDRRLDEGPGTVDPSAADQQLSSLVDGLADLFGQVGRRLLGRERPQRRGLVGGVPGLERRELTAHSLDEVVVDIREHDEPLRRHAALPGVGHPAGHRGADRTLQSFTVEDDEDVAAAQLQQAGLHVPPGPFGDLGPGAFAAGEGGTLHHGAVDDAGDLVVAHEQVHVDALGRPRVAEQHLQGECGLRTDPGVLDHDRVAQYQVGAREAHHLVEGEVPRHDAEQDTERLVDEVRLALLDVERLVGREARPVLRVVLEDRRGEIHLAAGLGDQLAHLQGDQVRKGFLH